MALTRNQKKAQLTALTENMKKAESVIFAHYIGLTVADVSALRAKLKEAKAEMKVAKKTLMRLATKEAGLPEIPEAALTGPVACIFSFSDPITGAQVAFTFAKDHQQVALIGGIYDGKILSKEEAVALAKMPGRQELLTIFAGMLQSPLRSFASICSSPLTGFARALAEVAKKKS
jgi:large subunit ribosomal protein L10